MLRLALLLAALVAPVAAAEPIASVAVGPDGLARPGEPYYLAADVSEPERPRPATREDDCGARRFDRPPVGVTVPNSLAPYFPGCVSAEHIVCGPAAVIGCVPARASYNVTTGRYYLEAAPFPAQTSSGAALTGTTGLGLRADCETCPPPP